MKNQYSPALVAKIKRVLPDIAKVISAEGERLLFDDDKNVREKLNLSPLGSYIRVKHLSYGNSLFCEFENNGIFSVERMSLVVLDYLKDYIERLRLAGKRQIWY